ncbi:hypothetical protein AB6Q56_07470 [Dechloromonas sp. ARDL1]|uniref:spike base protein, RCAP_Rcc01079 family n=1 Tax=Dechloromonas sp. ARDL1 TaxID=3322121 RepID=UPI003DA6D2B5
MLSAQPFDDIQVVTPSDDNDLPNGTCRALIFTAPGGNIAFTTAAGNDVTLPVTPALMGVQCIRAQRIKAAGTSATGIFACY